MEIKYSKPILSKKDFIRESGYPAAFVDRAVHCSFADQFTFRTSDAPNSKIFIVTDEFESYRRAGEFK